MSNGVPWPDGVPHFTSHCTSWQGLGCGNTPSEVNLRCVGPFCRARLECFLNYHPGHTDGSLTSLTYVDEAVSKRLHLLQGQLTRNVQHVAGLNPKAFRYAPVSVLSSMRLMSSCHSVVRNDRVARPLAKGVVDGNLLAAFEDLPVPRQVEMTRQIATERSTVLKDWLDLGGAW